MNKTIATHKDFYKITDFLPTTVKELKEFGWDSVDVVLFTGDAYVDHPSFGIPLIARVLQKHGYTVAIVPQPNWQDDLRDFKKFGKPNLFFGVSAGAMDSMVNHYTANKRLRSDDAYTPGGKAGFRPDYAVTVYSKILKELYPDVPVIIGGIEASLRRFTHYDYWQDSLKPSILFESKADLLVYGMGEKVIVDVAAKIKSGLSIDRLHSLPQTGFLVDAERYIPRQEQWKDVILHSHEECLSDKLKFAKNFKIIETLSNKHSDERLIERTFNKKIIINPPLPYLTETDLDAIYDLPFTRLPHPKYAKKETIPAYEMIKFSINTHRGCFGGCSFCTISAHQGKFISSRSEDSILREVDRLTQMPDFKGHISDLGGPSANMYRMKGKDETVCKTCSRYSCIHPKICPNLDTSHDQMNRLYKKVREHRDVKMVTIGSGIRYDLFDYTRMDIKEYVENLIKYHVSGRLKVAPEHTEDEVLKMMRKPSFELFRKFQAIFNLGNRKAGKNQQLIPYFISSHPGSSHQHMVELSNTMKSMGIRPEQVQDFTPTPMTLANVIFYTGIDPYTMNPVFSAKDKDAKLAQKDMFFWYKNSNPAAGKDKHGKSGSKHPPTKPTGNWNKNKKR